MSGLLARLLCRLFGHLPLVDFSAWTPARLSSGVKVQACPRCLRVPRP